MQAGYSAPDPEWVCECGDETCFEKVSVSIEEYQRIRSHEDWFFIRPGHDKPEVERIVSENGSFVVVEKL
jgi:hypothetical protein